MFVWEGARRAAGGEGGIKTETGMEQGTWVYMAAAAAVGAAAVGAGPKINKSDSLYLSA